MPRDILDLPVPAGGERIAYGPEPLQFGDLWMPEGIGPHPLMIFIHGGFWRAQYTLEYGGHLCAALAASGVAAWSIEYRRVGDVGGGWPGTLTDVLRGSQFAFESLAQSHAIDASRVAIAGHSAGGHLALWVAAQDKFPLARAINLGGVTDLKRAYVLQLGSGAVEQFLGGTPEDVPDRYGVASPIELLPIRAPQVMIHGSLDDVVPVELSERFCAASKNCEFVRLEGGDHFDVIDPGSTYWPVVMARLMV